MLWSRTDADDSGVDADADDDDYGDAELDGLWYWQLW